LSSSSLTRKISFIILHWIVHVIRDLPWWHLWLLLLLAIHVLLHLRVVPHLLLSSHRLLLLHLRVVATHRLSHWCTHWLLHLAHLLWWHANTTDCHTHRCLSHLLLVLSNSLSISVHYSLANVLSHHAISHGWLRLHSHHRLLLHPHHRWLLHAHHRLLLHTHHRLLLHPHHWWLHTAHGEIGTHWWRDRFAHHLIWLLLLLLLIDS